MEVESVNLYLKVKTNVDDIVVDSMDVRLASGKDIRLTWDESDINRTAFGFQARCKGVCFDEEYANGRLKELYGMQILDITLSSESKVYSLFFVEQIEFEDKEEKVFFRFPIVLSDVNVTDENVSEAELDFVTAYFLGIIIAEDVSDTVRINRFEAFQKMRRYLKHYQERGFPLELIFGIMVRKGYMILCATTKKEMEGIVIPKVPRYDGSKFIPDEYFVPQEEVICWSETSLIAPLNHVGLKRYLELFKMVFPEKHKELERNVYVI